MCIRDSNAWAKENQDKLQQTFLMTSPKVATENTLYIGPVSYTHLAIYVYEKGLAGGKFSMSTFVNLFQSVIGLILVLLSDTVSYTHLDVYKRQAYRYTGHGKARVFVWINIRF